MAVSNVDNDSGPKEVYEGRTVFDETFEEEDHINLWETIPHYGKVNLTGAPVLLKENKLKYVNELDDPVAIACLNFVADAFVDLRSSYRTAYKRGVITTFSKFPEKLTPKKGWTSINNFYAGYIDELFFEFLENKLFVLRNSDDITSFEDLIPFLLDFLKETRKPITRAGFLASKHNSILSTGFALDIAEHEEITDALREEYFSDPNFVYFKYLALRFGFKVDYGVPWRLVADIRSSNLQKYIEKYFNIELKPEALFEEIFNENFSNIFQTTEFQSGYFDEFVFILEAFYKAFRATYPTYSIIKNTKCFKNAIFVKERDLFKKMSDGEYLDLFYQIRLLETAKRLNPNRIQLEQSSYRAIYKSYKLAGLPHTGRQKAINFINETLGTLAYRDPELDSYNLTRK